MSLSGHTQTWTTFSNIHSLWNNIFYIYFVLLCVLKVKGENIPPFRCPLSFIQCRLSEMNYHMVKIFANEST